MLRDMSMWLVSAGVIGVIGVQGVLTALHIGVLALLLLTLLLLLLLWLLGGRPPRLPPLVEGVRGRFIPDKDAEEVLGTGKAERGIKFG
jgi:hypothetical protein